MTYTPFTANAAYTGDTNCGNVYVSGNYTHSLTIASDNDIIINGNITRRRPRALRRGHTPTGHPAARAGRQRLRPGLPPGAPDRTQTTGGNCDGGSDPRDTGSLTNPYIYAAILAVNHSFIVDNYDCGVPLGTLRLRRDRPALPRPGRHRLRRSISTGYLKDYNYDDRLADDRAAVLPQPGLGRRLVPRETECDASTC